VIVEHPGIIAGRYRIGEPLGSGGMGTVYAGHDLRLDRDVAVKVLRDDLTRDPAVRRRFEREARAAARVAHPHAVAIYDTGEDAAGDAYIVMECLTGRTLGDELARGPLDEDALRRVADAVLGALSAAHAEGIVHRDVKPGNILLAEDGTLKVGDFGIATTLDPGDTTTRVPMGTPAYTAPERLRGLAATECSDLYSLGVVLYEAAAGERPFRGDGALAVAEAVVAGAHRPLHELRPDLSAAFVATVERALATDPADRFADADEMRAALDAPATTPIGATVPLVPPATEAPVTETALLAPPAPPARRVPSSATSVPVAPATRGRRRVDRRLAVVMGVVAVVVLVVVAVALLVTSGDDTAAPPASTAPATVTTAAPAPVAGPATPAPLARALDRLDEATQP
jgi:serine/threonine protein kinase